MTHTNEQILEALKSSVSDTLEGMLFAEPEELNEEQMQEIDWNNLSYNIYSIPLKELGELFLIFSNSHIQEVTGMLLGEENPSEESCQDAIKEVVNSVAGCFMSELLGQDTIFELGLPSCTNTPFSPGSYTHISYFDIDGNPIIAAIRDLKHIPDT